MLEKSLKVLAWVQIVLGSLAVINWTDTAEGASFLGGVLFIGCGIVGLVYIAKIRAEAHERFKNR